MLNDHYKRIEDGLNNVFHLHNLASYAEKHIILESKKLSFTGGYEFQRAILNDDSRVTNTVKPAQIGLTVSTICYFLSALATQKQFNVIYALPSTNDATKLTITKVNPILYGSPDLKRLLNVNVDSTELKEINGNFLFIRGTRSETAALSISADCLVADEIDRCDPDTLKQFRSRLQASKHQIIRQFSTPTQEGVGISKEAETSKRIRHMGICNCCGHKWLPSYHTDIVIPGYYDDLKGLTKYNIKDYQWQKAHWMCPSCRRDPQFDPTRLEWVVENPDDNYEAHTHYVTPVTACRLLVPAYLVRTSTEFNTRAEWQNQVLGETSEDTNEQLTAADISKALVQADLSSSAIHFMGFDMGLLCAVTIGRLSNEGLLLVVHREMVPLSKFRERRLELIRQYRVVISVHDVQPYVSEIMSVCEVDTNAYGAVFTTSKNPQMYTVADKDEDAEEGKLNLRLLKINRTAAFDKLLEIFKENKIFISKGADDGVLQEHYLSLKRTKIFQNDELVFSWQKTDGQDHYFFSLMYMFLATTLLGTVSGWTEPGRTPLLVAFRPKEYS